MKARTWIVAAGLALVVAALFTFRGAAFAQGPGNGPGRGAGPMGGPEQSLVAVAASQLNMTEQALIERLQGGATIADVAKERGVTTDAIVTAFVAQRADRLQAAVAAGRLTQADADARIATMKANVTARLAQPMATYGPGNGYADADGDGVCDNRGSRMGGGRMGGIGRGGR